MIKAWNNNWRFAKKDETFIGVTLPHTWYADGDYYLGDATYVKEFTKDEVKADRVFVRFNGVDKICKVFINDELIGEHLGGYSIFSCELTKYIKEQNELKVLVNNETGDSVSPLSGDFTIFGGIHRDVELILANDTCFDYTYFGTNGVIINPRMVEGKGVLAVEPHVLNENDCQIKYEIFDAEDKKIAEKNSKTDKAIEIELEEVTAWDGKNNPYLYTFRAVLYSGENICDQMELKTGFRDIRMDANTGFYLNGAHLKLNGVAKHQDSAEVFSAATMKNWKRDIELIEEIGANAIRLSHYQHPYQVYDLCDQNGFVVWAEIPMLKMINNDKLLENASIQLKELILQNLHHPSICFWGVQNEIAMFGEESFMYEEVGKLNDLVHELDPYRLSTSANLNSVEIDSKLNKITDTVAYNLYFGWYYGELEDFGPFVDEFHKQNKDIPLGISEYGADCNLAFHSTQPKVKDYSEEFQSKFHETVYPQLRDRDFIWGTFVWNMFDFVSGIRDEGGIKYRNNKGLVTHDRNTCKDSFYFYKANWSSDPFVYIAEKRYKKRNAEKMDVKIYSNQEKVILMTAGKSIEQSGENGVFIFKDIPLVMGENNMRVLAGDATDYASFDRVEEAEESYIFVDPNPGINVKNWFVDIVDSSFSLLDTVEDLRNNKDVMEYMDANFKNIADIMRDGIGTFTLEGTLSYFKGSCTEAEAKEINENLMKIKK